MNTNLKLSLSRFDIGMPHEVSEEFTLPDYMPEVRRIVSCTAQVLPENKYLESSEVSLSGLAAYTVLYVGEDGELVSAPLNSEYSVRIPCQNCDMSDLGVGDIGSHTVLENVTCRATGPRRLSLTGRMRSRIFAAGAEEMREKTVLGAGSGGDVTAADEMSLERHKRRVECSAPAFASVTGSASGELREREGTKVISCGGSVSVSDVHFDGDAAVIRGDAYAEFLLVSSDGEYSSSRVKAPFEERVSPDFHRRIPDGAARSAAAFARCAAVSINGGDGGVFLWELEYDIDALISATYGVEVTDDAYSTSYDSSIVYNDCDVLLCLKNTNSHLSVSGSKQVAYGEGRSISHVSGRAALDRYDIQPDGKIVLSGSCTVTVTVGGEGEFSCEEIVIPVRYECDGARFELGVPSAICDISMIYADARLDGGRLSVDAELGISLSASLSQKTRLVGEVLLDKNSPLDVKGSCVKIYYPYENEDIWDIGKKYRCETGKISFCEGGSPAIITR
ncbi:MAG: hypothetical protein HFE30_02335 [Clostridiales bacterium]|nr:hypothetical protein [Clostridiales bacterium]